MKFNRILIVGLILAIFAIGAVSASDDIISDENLTVETSVYDSSIQIDDSNENISVVADDCEDVIGNDNANDDKLSYDEDDVYCEVYDVSLDDEDNEVIYFRSYDSSATGTLNIYVNNALKNQQTIDYDDYEYYYEDGYYYSKYYYPDDLGITTSGDYTIRVTLNGNQLISQTIHVSAYTFYVYAENEDEGTYLEYGDTVNVYVVLPYDATNRLTVNVNGKTYDVAYKDGRGKLSLSTAGWNLGSYKVTANYAGNYKYSPNQDTETIYINPKIHYPSDMSVGEKESITFTAPSGNGNMVVTGYKYDDYNDDYVQFTAQNVAIVNGRGSYSLASLPFDDDQYKFRISYNVGSFSDEYTAYVQVRQNSPGFSSSVTPTTIIVGNGVNVRLSGPKLNSMVGIYVDDSLNKEVSLIAGSVNEVLTTGLSVGTHKINVYFNDGSYFYSNTYYVTVKPVPVPAPKISLSLKKVKVKKSAKKLVLKATLKINGKKVKGKTIKFKFNKKTYKAKTNKKGVAKVTIKKKVLKKLKVGKKVKYQATFGKKTVKKTVKVKK